MFLSAINLPLRIVGFASQVAVHAASSLLKIPEALPKKAPRHNLMVPLFFFFPIELN